MMQDHLQRLSVANDADAIVYIGEDQPGAILAQTSPLNRALAIIVDAMQLELRIVRGDAESFRVERLQEVAN